MLSPPLHQAGQSEADDPCSSEKVNADSGQIARFGYYIEKSDKQ